MTELQWLIKILTQHKLNNELKDLLIARIGEVESRLSNHRQFISPNPPSIIQAPSTQRILDEISSPMPMVPKPVVAIDKETGRPMVDTGRGTSGPRKF